MAFTEVTISQNYDLADGTEPSGTVTFTPNAPLLNSGTVVPAAPVTASLNSAGTFSVTLVSNTDPATLPQGSAYTVLEVLNGIRRNYTVQVPHDQGAALNLYDLAQLAAPPALSFPTAAGGGGGGPYTLSRLVQNGSSGYPSRPPVGYVDFLGVSDPGVLLLDGDTWTQMPASVPDAPTIVTATAGSGSAAVAFTGSTWDGGSTITGYTATSSPGGITGSGTSAPITVNGLANGTAYTFTVHATNTVGNSAESTPSNSVTPTGSTTAPTFGVAGTPTSGATTASLDIAAPASVVANSVVLAFIARDDSVQNTPYESVTPPADWAHVTDNPDSAGATNTAHSVLCDVLWHRATGSESGPYTFTWATSRFCTGVAIRLDGCQATGTPFEVDDGANSTGTAVQANTPDVAVTTTDVNRLLVWAGWTWTAAGWTFPTGFTTRVNNAPFDLVAVATKVAASAGATGAINGSQSASEPHGAWVGAFVGT